MSSLVIQSMHWAIQERRQFGDHVLNEPTMRISHIVKNSTEPNSQGKSLQTFEIPLLFLWQHERT